MADKLDINEVLAHIDNIDMGYFDSLSDEDKKLFQPYVVLRWMTSLNDSVVLKYKSSLFESVTGKWKEGGKDTCKQIVDAVNNLTGYTNSYQTSSPFSLIGTSGNTYYNVVGSKKDAFLITTYTNNRDFNFIFSVRLTFHYL